MKSFDPVKLSIRLMRRDIVRNRKIFGHADLIYRALVGLYEDTDLDRDHSAMREARREIQRIEGKHKEAKP